jgi:hypothetical protein
MYKINTKKEILNMKRVQHMVKMKTLMIKKPIIQ